jgi:hypothetical protein
MMTTKHTNVLNTLFTYLIVLLIFTIGCTAQTITVAPSPIPTNTPLPPTAIPPTPTPTTIPRPPLSADEVKTIAAEFERVSQLNFQSWTNRDFNLMSQLFTDDISYYEVGNNSICSYNSCLVDLNKTVLSDWPDFKIRLVDTYIGQTDGFAINEMWNYWTEYGFTQDNPATDYDWLTLRDGKISIEWLFWGSNVYTARGDTFHPKMIQAYETAWSSGNPEAVASLYDPKVVRTDSLFEENQQGSSAVKEFATTFFAWYPGVRLELLKSFELYTSSPLRTGGVYAIHVTDQAGKPCDVRAIILLESSQDKITNEWLFYNADSLIACGWAQ